MAAYVAMCSLRHTIKCIVDSSVIWASDSSRPIMSVLEDVVHSLFMERENGLSRQIEIRDAIFEFEDVLESHISNRYISSQSEDINLVEIKQDVDSFAETINKLLVVDLRRSNDADEDDQDVPSRVDIGGSFNDRYIELSGQFSEIKNRLLTDNLSSNEATVFSLLGMAGIGQKYQLRQLVRDILKQLTGPQVNDGKILVVLDDLWNKNLPSLLSTLSNISPNHALVILLTSRLQEVQVSAATTYTIRFMDKKESWDLLCHKVFGKMSCPPQLEKVGKMIAEKCEGLPLIIVTVADIMSKANDDEKTSEEYWNKVATEKRNSVFMDAYDQMFEVLYRSYNYLKHDCRPCFLYLAVFPQKHEISCSMLIKLFLTEGFLLDSVFEEFVSNNVVIAHKQSLVIKTCSLHSSFLHMCNKEAGKIKLFHSLNSPEEGLDEEDLKSIRRLCIRDNVLLANKDVYDSMASASKVRSLLCTGPYHKYPVPICLEYLRLLKILHALTIRFYEFPIEALMKLVQLRYLALTYDGNLPRSIFEPFKLHYLIVHRHLCIVESVENTSYLPRGFWLMKNLKYLHIVGTNIPEPPFRQVRLPNLQTLLDMSPQSCTKEVFGGMPSLEKLGIRIELAPDNDEPLCFFDHISHLEELRKLKCVIVNPEIMSDDSLIVPPPPPPPPLPIFTGYLNKLTLSGFGYKWEDMYKIASLPNLQVLKLQCYAFRGPKWEVNENDFPCLLYLLIEDSDLVHLTSGDSLCLPQLRRLSIRHCYKLREIPLNFGEHLTNIELVECNTLTLACANKLKADRDTHNYSPLDISVHSSWDV